MADLQEQMANELASIVTRSRVLLNSPGNSLTAAHLYANPESAKIDVVPVLNTRGRLEISTNSLNLGATSTFQIPPGSFLAQCWLIASINVARYVHATQGWLLDQIEQVTYQFSGNSSINNVQITGASHKSLVMAACKTKEKRDAILAAAGDYLNATAAALTNQQAACPLFLPWSNPDVIGTFPYDTSTLASNIIVEIKWKSPDTGAFMGESGQTPNMPTAFNNLTLKAHQSDIQGAAAFRVSTAMVADPALNYAFPMLLTQTFSTFNNVTSGAEGTITLSALPTGQLVGILLTVTPSTWAGVSGNQNVVQGVSAICSKLNLRYNGQDIIKYVYEKEKQLVDAIQSEGNGYYYSQQSMTSISNGAAATYTGAVNVMNLMYDLEGCFNEKHFEHVPNYGGSTLEFLYRIDTAGLSSTSCRFDFCYIFNAICNNENRVTDISVA